LKLIKVNENLKTLQLRNSAVTHDNIWLTDVR